MKEQERLLIIYFFAVNLHTGNLAMFFNIFGVKWIRPFEVKNLLVSWKGQESDIRF